VSQRPLEILVQFALRGGSGGTSQREECSEEQSHRESPGMTKAPLHLLKGIGYLISTGSVILLAIVSWSSASESPALTAYLIGGAALSIVGMFCRWLTYQIEKRRQDN
jgi:hypothetical protein